MLGSHTQLPSITGPVQFRPQGAGARLTLEHESAHAAAGISKAAAAIAIPANVFFARIEVLSNCLARIALIGAEIRAERGKPTT